MRRHKPRPRRKSGHQYKRLRVPRLVSVEYDVVTELGSGRERHAVVSKMLGVAFTRLQLQNLKDKAYYRHPLRRYQGGKNVKTKIIVEKLSPVLLKPAAGSPVPTRPVQPIAAPRSHA